MEHITENEAQEINKEEQEHDAQIVYDDQSYVTEIDTVIDSDSSSGNKQI